MSPIEASGLPGASSSPAPVAVAAPARQPVASKPAATKTTPPAPASRPSPPGAAKPSSASPLAPSCQSNTTLSQSPDSSYTFICTVGGRPIAWPDGNIKLYQTGLTPIQTAALSAALPQWQNDGHFNVIQVASPAEANVTITNAPLNNSEDGLATTSYLCTVSRCWYSRADVQLSSTATLVQTLWVSTVLHELGHVAGLNHVARKGEVMYPYIDDLSPAVYSSGDKAGLEAEYQARGGSAGTRSAVVSAGSLSMAASSANAFSCRL